MYDAGRKMGKAETAISPSKSDKYYPHLDLDSKQFPMLKDMKVGKKCVLMIEVKPTSFSVNEREGQEENSSMCMEVLRVGMAEDQDAVMEKDEKMEKMVEKMYPSKIGEKSRE